MATPRITVTTTKGDDGEPTEVLLYVNPEGRDLLVRELMRLDPTNEHFHLMGASWGVGNLREIAYAADETALPHLKVLFRLDEWDQQYFPHVMKDDDASA